MTLLEAAKQALEALEVATTPLAKDRQEVLRAQAALRQAIAEAESAAPREWQGLTEKELRDVLKGTNHMIYNSMHGPFWPELEQACRAIEAHLKEKNT